MMVNAVVEAMKSEKRNIVRVAAAIISREGRYLIAKRKAGVHLAGFWEFPGGKCEIGESLEDCLRARTTGGTGCDHLESGSVRDHSPFLSR